MRFRRRTDQEDDVTTTEDHPGTAPAAPADQSRPTCFVCRGTGRRLNTHDYLIESLRLFPTDNAAQMDGVVVEFYGRVVKADEGKDPGDRLAPLFPPDLVTADQTALDSKGKQQRDVLLSAIVGLATYYDPDHPESKDMKHLVTLLEKWGRTHKAFPRPDGTVRGAEPEEYLQVRDIFLGLMRDAFGERWLPEYQRAWKAAFRFAMDVMLRAADEATPPGAADPGFARMTRAAR